MTAVLLGLVGIVVFAFLKLRSSSRGTVTMGQDRLSEEAFAAATIQAALAARPAPASGVAGLAAAGLPAPPSADARRGHARRRRARRAAGRAGRRPTKPESSAAARRLAREWLAIVGPGTGHPFRASLPAWPALADALAARARRRCRAAVRAAGRHRGGAGSRHGIRRALDAAHAAVAARWRCSAPRPADSRRDDANGDVVAPGQRPRARARQQPDDRARLRPSHRSQPAERGRPIGARAHQHRAPRRC